MKIPSLLKPYTDGFLSLIYPNPCVVCGNETSSKNEFFCFACKENLPFTHFEKYREPTSAEQLFWGRVPFEMVYSMLHFHKGNPTQKILHQIKYKEGKELGFYMGVTMGERLKSIKQFQTVDALIPVPVHSLKEFRRGYNQSLLIAQGISEATGVKVKEALFRRKNDSSQTHKSGAERYKNVSGKFGLKQDILKNEHHVMIIDDVLTTGATIEFAAKAILNSSENKELKLSVATIAKAEG